MIDIMLFCFTVFRKRNCNAAENKCRLLNCLPLQYLTRCNLPAATMRISHSANCTPWPLTGGKGGATIFKVGVAKKFFDPPPLLAYLGGT